MYNKKHWSKRINQQALDEQVNRFIRATPLTTDAECYAAIQAHRAGRYVRSEHERRLADRLAEMKKQGKL